MCMYTYIYIWGKLWAVRFVLSAQVASTRVDMLTCSIGFEHLHIFQILGIFGFGSCKASRWRGACMHAVRNV